MQAILLVKETRAQETRVALIPHDVGILIQSGFNVYIEHQAGAASGFSDEDYIKVGGRIRYLQNDTLPAFQKLFQDIQIVVRAKRPDSGREALENQAMAPGTYLIGSLDPLEKHSAHLDEYRRAQINAYSIDQLSLPVTDPMNVLAAMSKIAGKLALLDAIEKFKGPIHKVVIISFGVVGQSAFAEAMQQHLATTVVLSNSTQVPMIINQGGRAILINKEDTLTQQQASILTEVEDANIVITAARRPNQVAPLLLPTSTLNRMQSGSVIVDMALSEGGNVEGSEHDAMHELGNGVLVTNTSGYPKAYPQAASILWSQATLLFILQLFEKPLPPDMLSVSNIKSQLAQIKVQ